MWSAPVWRALEQQMWPDLISSSPDGVPDLVEKTGKNEQASKETNEYNLSWAEEWTEDEDEDGSLSECSQHLDLY